MSVYLNKFWRIFVSVLGILMILSVGIGIGLSAFDKYRYNPIVQCMTLVPIFMCITAMFVFAIIHLIIFAKDND